MGLCLAFGPRIREGCDHAMVAAATACYCAECGVLCEGKFDGCPSVWAGAPAVPVSFTPRAPARVAVVEVAAEPDPDVVVVVDKVVKDHDDRSYEAAVAFERIGAEVKAVAGALDRLRSEMRGTLDDLRGATERSIAEIREETDAALHQLRTEMREDVKELHAATKRSTAEVRAETDPALERVRTEFRRTVEELQAATKLAIADLVAETNAISTTLNELRTQTHGALEQHRDAIDILEARWEPPPDVAAPTSGPVRMAESPPPKPVPKAPPPPPRGAEHVDPASPESVKLGSTDFVAPEAVDLDAGTIGPPNTRN